MTTTETTRRINLNRVSPEVYEAMMLLSNAAAKDIDGDLAELIKIRASQMNHCAFCLDMHTADARKRGISEQKLAVLSAWEEAEGVFTEQEQAALALTEEMTDLTRQSQVTAKELSLRNYSGAHSKIQQENTKIAVPNSTPKR